MLFAALMVIGVLAIVQGALAMRAGRGFLRFVEEQLRNPPPRWTPMATVVLPCKGVDNRLEQTLRAVADQDYPAYEVICAVESADDPAYALIQSLARAGRVPLRCVVAGLSQGCAQKITNHLAALAEASAQSQVFAFLDSDAVPHRTWLADLVSPLADPQVGATTGFRWYVPTGSLTSLLRCVWNASALTFLGDHRFNFCWGGSTAIRREVFTRLEIARRWSRALSEDYLMTQSINRAGLRVRFVPRCVLPSDEEASWVFITRFARRQLVITRVCHPRFWAVAMGMAVQVSVGFWGCVLWLCFGSAGAARWQIIAAAAAPAAIYALAYARSALRDRAVAALFPDAAMRRGVLLADGVFSPVIALMHLALLLSSATSNRFWWRDVKYEMVNVETTRIIARRREHPAPAAPAGEPQSAEIGP